MVVPEEIVAGISHRSIILIDGRMYQLTAAQVGIGFRALVLLDGELKERALAEGVPIIYLNGRIQTLPSGDTLIV